MPCLLLALLLAVPALASDPIGDIEYFGYKGLPIAHVRAAMPVHEGATYSSRTKDEVRRVIWVASIKRGEQTREPRSACSTKGRLQCYGGSI